MMLSCVFQEGVDMAVIEGSLWMLFLSLLVGGFVSHGGARMNFAMGAGVVLVLICVLFFLFG